MDEMTLTLNNPITEEQWDVLTDVDFDNTEEIYFHTKHGKEVHFVKRKTGKWIKKMRVTETEKYTSYDPDWYCACCGAKYDPHIARMVNYCYVCGADMRGEQKEAE